MRTTQRGKISRKPKHSRAICSHWNCPQKQKILQFGPLRARSVVGCWVFNLLTLELERMEATWSSVVCGEGG